MIERKRLFLIVQLGYATYGIGETEQLALEDACEWLENDDGIQGGLSPEDVSAKLVPLHEATDGDLVMLPPGADRSKYTS